jgi:hypothetical protein
LQRLPESIGRQNTMTILLKKKWTYSTYENRNRARQIIKAIIINGGKEYKFEDWSRDYDEYHKNYQWQGSCEYAETY